MKGQYWTRESHNKIVIEVKETLFLVIHDRKWWNWFTKFRENNQHDLTPIHRGFARDHSK